MTPQEKAKYLDSFTLNPINSHLPPSSPTSSRPDSSQELKKSSRGIYKFRKSLKSDAENYERMKRLNATGQRLQVLRSPIQGMGVYAKQPIKYATALTPLILP
jgi:hypothetical protein